MPATCEHPTADISCRGCSRRTIGYWRDAETGERLPLCPGCQVGAAKRPELLQALAKEAALLHGARIARVVDRVRASLVVN